MLSDRDKLVAVATSYTELMELRDRQAATMAQMIRGCIAALRQTNEQAQRALERAQRSGAPGHFRGNVPSSTDVARKVRDDRILAFLYLERLATMLEDQNHERKSPCTPA